MRNILVLVLIVCTFLPLAAAPPAANPRPPQDASSPMDRTVDMDIKDTPLEQALGMLLKPAGVSYRVDPEVADLKVTAVLRGISADLALQEVLKAAGADMRTENGVLHVMAPPVFQNGRTVELERKLIELRTQLAVALRNKTEKSPEVGDLKVQIEVLEELLAVERKSVAQHMAAVEADMAAATTRNQPQPAVTRVFTIDCINPAELVPLIYAMGARQVTVVSGGKLVVNAPEQVLEEATEIIRELDTEEALPRPVRVEVVAKYDLTDDAGEKESFEVGTQGSVPEGTPIALRVVGGAKSELFNQPLLLDVGFIPEIGAGSQISLSGNVSISAMTDQIITVALSTSPVALSMTSGKQQVISSGTLGIEGGKLRFEVLATVTIGEGRLRTKIGSGGGGGFGVPGVGNFGGYGGVGFGPADSVGGSQGGQGSYGGTMPAAGAPPPADGVGGQGPAPTDASSDGVGK